MFDKYLLFFFSKENNGFLLIKMFVIVLRTGLFVFSRNCRYASKIKIKKGSRSKYLERNLYTFFIVLYYEREKIPLVLFIIYTVQSSKTIIIIKYNISYLIWNVILYLKSSNDISKRSTEFLRVLVYTRVVFSNKFLIYYRKVYWFSKIVAINYFISVRVVQLFSPIHWKIKQPLVTVIVCTRISTKTN